MNLITKMYKNSCFNLERAHMQDLPEAIFIQSEGSIIEMSFHSSKTGTGAKYVYVSKRPSLPLNTTGLTVMENYMKYESDSINVYDI